MELNMNNRLTRGLLIGMALFLMSGCGATMQSNSTTLGYGTIDLSSRTVDTDGGQAKCNMFDSKETTLAGRVTSYFDLAGTLQEDKVRIRLTNLTNLFDTNTNVHIKMFRWKADKGSSPELDANPVSFTLESGGGNGFAGYAITEPMTSLNLTKMAEIRTNKGVYGTTTYEFLSNVTVVPQGVDYNWDALKIVVYDGTTKVGAVDFLLPIFSANPNVYATDHPSVLAKLHPYYNERTQSRTDAVWESMTQSFCF